jgi:hypothetical protein
MEKQRMLENKEGRRKRENEYKQRRETIAFAVFH